VRNLLLTAIFLIIPAMFFAQTGESINRGSIPEELLRPGRGESPRYPVDTVIGELGRGQASSSAYAFGQSVGEGLLQGRMNHPGFDSINTVMLESYLSALEPINARIYRLGSGREEPDGAVSFLVRFIGREEAITGELFIRQIIDDTDDTENITEWIFEELILEQARKLEAGEEEAGYRSDSFPYERLF
jgi:hypothetical protein